MERFWSRVDKSGECWIWTGGKSGNGYAQIRIKYRKVMVHRYAFETLVGPIPHGLQLDHLCRNRVCVNPAHLEPVTARENTMRSFSFSALNARKTHCPLGHAFDASWKSGVRGCKTCRRERARRRRARAAAARSAA